MTLFFYEINCEENIKLVWKDSAKSRKVLGYNANAKLLRQIIARPHPYGFGDLYERLALAEKHQGPTLFDVLASIIKSHMHIDFVLG